MGCQYPDNAALTGYRYGCRCERCVNAHREYYNAYRAKRRERYQALAREQHKRNADKRRAYARNWRAQNKDKKRAQNKVRTEIRAGRMKRQPCEECGGKNAHAHHHDYARPLDVTWLCPSCHRLEHGT